MTRLRALLVVILLLSATSCRTGDASSDTSAIPAAALEQRQQQIDEIVAKLRPHGLVYDLNKTVKVNGKSVTLKLLAVDRDTAFLEFGEDRPPGFMFDLLEGSDPALPAGPHPVAGPALVYTAFNSSPDPGVSTLTLQVRTFNGKPTSAGRVQVPVDLSALEQLPQPQQPPGTVTKNGMRFEVSQFRPGYAVTSVDLQGTIVNAKALYLTVRPQPGSPQSGLDLAMSGGGSWSLGVSASGGAPVMFGMSAGQFNADGWQATVQLLDSPTHGDLEFRLDWIYLKGLDTAGDMRTARGPWDLTVQITLSQ